MYKDCSETVFFLEIIIFRDNIYILEKWLVL